MVTCKICDSGTVKDLVYRQGVYQCLECKSLFRTKPFDYKWYPEVGYPIPYGL